MGICLLGLRHERVRKLRKFKLIGLMTFCCHQGSSTRSKSKDIEKAFKRGEFCLWSSWVYALKKASTFERNIFWTWTGFNKSPLVVLVLPVVNEKKIALQLIFMYSEDLSYSDYGKKGRRNSNKITKVWHKNLFNRKFIASWKTHFATSFSARYELGSISGKLGAKFSKKGKKSFSNTHWTQNFPGC